MKINTKALIALLHITLLITLAINSNAQTTDSVGGELVPYAVPPPGGFPKSVTNSPAPPTTAPQVTDGMWIPLINQAPDNIHLMLLLSDGTVMAKGMSGGGDGYGNAWYRFTPDANGNYVNGTWSTLAPMHDTRFWFSSQVLKDGRVFVAGGEYGSGGPKAEIYDPIANSWKQINPPTGLASNFYDSVSEIRPDGKVLVAPVFPYVSGGTLLYDPAINTWSAGGILANGATYQDEASWVKLPDNSILTIDPFGRNSSRYIPSTNAWISDATVPVDLYDPFGSEIGAGFLLPSGKAFFLGATGHTAIYTPSGTTSPGSWAAGPDIPNSQGTPDAGAAMMINGKILCAVSPLPTNDNHFRSPTSFYEYNYSTNLFARVAGPTGLTENHPSYQSLMLDLPDGSVLYTSIGTQLYVYRPVGTPRPAWKPTITSISRKGNGSYHLVGTLLNGISEGAAYGDDTQMRTNYPIVRLTDPISQQVYYARTYNWSSTGVMTGNTQETTEFTLPANFPRTGSTAYLLVIVANGIASDPVTFTLTATGAPVVTTNPATLIASFSATLNGTVDPHGLTTNVYFQYGPTTSYGSTTPMQSHSGNTYLNVSANIGNLSASKVYHFRIVATNTAGTTFSADRTFTTLTATGPPVVTTNPASPIASFSAALNGLLDPHGLTTSVHFQYGSTTSYGLTTAPQSQSGNTYRNVSSNINSLMASTTYHFRIVTSNAAGTRYGTDRTFTTQ